MIDINFHKIPNLVGESDAVAGRAGAAVSPPTLQAKSSLVPALAREYSIWEQP